jgi:Ni/Co efflux regulator RcnB
MKKLIASVLMVAAMAGPLASGASARPDGCALAKKLGVVWVKECGNDV